MNVIDNKINLQQQNFITLQRIILSSFIFCNLSVMKVRTQRTHFTGFSNRNPSNPGRTTTSDMYQKSFTKSRSHYYAASDKINNNTTAHFNYSTSKSFHQPQSSSQLNINSIYQAAQKGHHYQFESKRWVNNHNNSKNLESFYQDHINLAPLPLTFNQKLNSQLLDIKAAFQNKEVNLHKLSELKRTFLLNNEKRRNLKSLFGQFANNQGIVDKNGFRRLIKSYGYDVNESEVDLVFRLNQVHDKEQSATVSASSKVTNGLDLPQFINLMTKQNIYFKTIKLDSNSITSTTSYRFSPGQFQIFRNKFNKLKQAFNIYKNEPINQQTFQKVMKKLDINDLVISQQKRLQIYESFAKEDERLNVEQFLGVIAAQQHERVSKSGNQLKVTNYDHFEENIQANQEFNFEKVQKQDPLLQELYPVNLKKASFVEYQRRVKSAQQICQKLKHLNQSRSIITQLCSSHPAISKTDLYKKVQTLLQSQGYNFSKNQYKSFLSFIDFDSRNNISSQKLQAIVLNETERQKVNRLDRRVRNDEKRENEEQVTKSKVKEDEFVERFRSKSSINWSSVKKNTIKQDNITEFKIPTKFSAWPQRLHQADFTLLQAKSNFGMGLTQHQRFNKDEKHSFGQQDKLRKIKMYENKVRKIAEWSQVNQRRLADKTCLQDGKDAARQYNLRLIKEQYQEQCASKAN